MSDLHHPGKPRDKATLEQQIMDSCIAKNDAEWWAMREIERLRASNKELVATSANAIVFLFEMFSHEGEDIQSWIDELGEGGANCPDLADAVRIAIAKAKAEPKLEPQNYKIQPPTFVPKG